MKVTIKSLILKGVARPVMGVKVIYSKPFIFQGVAAPTLQLDEHH